MSDDVNALQAQLAEAYETGGYVGAAPYAERIVAAIDKWWLNGSGDALVLRVRMRYVLARAAIDQGRHPDAAAHVAKGRRAAQRATALGDPRIAPEHALLLLAGGEALVIGGDPAGALAEYAEADALLDAADAAGHVSPDGDANETRVHVALARQYALQELGRYDESLRSAQRALDLATAHEPGLVPAALERMALVRRLSGAGDDGDPHLQAAEAIGAASDIGGPQRAELSRALASRALETGDLDAAARHIDDAEREFLAIGDVRRAAYAGVGRADILRQRGEHDAAIEAALAAETRGEQLGETSVRTEALTIAAMALDESRRSGRAVELHERARAIAAEAGDALELVRIDVRLGVALHNAASLAAAAHASGGRGGAFGRAARRAGAVPDDGARSHGGAGFGGRRRGGTGPGRGPGEPDAGAAAGGTEHGARTEQSAGGGVGRSSSAPAVPPDLLAQLGAEAADLLARAVDTAVPAALAADAIRFDLEPGVSRESWAANVSLPVFDLALRVLTALQRADEIVALLEYAAAGAALDPAPREPVPAGAAERRGAPDRLTPPPRVRTDPAGGSAVDWALDAADLRYGLALRASTEVTAW